MYTELVWQGLSLQCFLRKYSVIFRKVLFTLIDDSFMCEDLPLFTKLTARKVIVSKFKFFILKLRVCSFVCCNGVCKSGLSSQKLNTNGTLQRDARCGLFSKNSFSFCCAIYSTNVQIERTWKDSPRAYICCRT